MQTDLATTGTNALLEQLSVFIPEEFINELIPQHTGRGRRPHWSSAQLYRLAVASQLHDFRQTLGVGGLRRINEHLLAPLLQSLLPERKVIGLIDATDLPAATSAYKKRLPVATLLKGRPWAVERSRPAKAAGLSATRNTPSACGFSSGRTGSC